MRQNTKRLVTLAAVTTVCAMGVLAFSRTPVGIAVLTSKAHFVGCEADARVLYEPGAGDRARTVVAHLPEAIARIEAEQLLPFDRDFRIYVCNSHESLNAYMGAPAGQRAVGVKVLNDIFLSPSAFSSPSGDTVSAILMHELSHVHLYQRMGYLRTLRELPAWFQEGLGVVVSGGGAAAVSDGEAIGAILSGHHFTPDERGGYWRPKRASDYGVGTHMFYKQSELFVAYMRGTRSEEFRDFLLALQLQEWSSFGSLFSETFGMSVEAMWSEFLEHVRRLQRSSDSEATPRITSDQSVISQSLAQSARIC